MADGCCAGAAAGAGGAAPFFVGAGGGAATFAGGCDGLRRVGDAAREEDDRDGARAADRRPPDGREDLLPILASLLVAHSEKCGNWRAGSQLTV